MAGPLVRSTEAPRAVRVTAASAELETELFVALQYQDDEAEVEVPLHEILTFSDAIRVLMLSYVCVVYILSIF